ncbi:aminotransferase class I/II-fold pyridoxal phosphate-dependent enzyme [Candidatus Micrarchaeota archaeon]|nr:aminotransferase class I/II-fold pyridoxal phosphate-dependent enzyme [Candidatus Micrarchaeota archaeon]
MRRVLTREEIAFANDIRGNVPKSMGFLLSKLFKGRDALDFSSGDLPKCLGNGRFKTIDEAMRKFPPSGMAYDHPLYRQAQELIWNYLTGLDPRIMDSERARAHVISGISTFMKDSLRACAYALGYSEESLKQRAPLVIIVAPTHPHWIASIGELFGYENIRMIRRLPTGKPDPEDIERVFKEIDRPFISIISPDENPSGICTPNDCYINDQHTGIVDRTVSHTRWGITLLDNIYSDAAWGENAGKRRELVQKMHHMGARALVMHSLSKIFMKPGARIGGVAYIGPLDGDGEEVGLDLLTRLKSIVDGNIKNGISGVAIPGLIEAYDQPEHIVREMLEVVEILRMRAMQNLDILNSGPVELAYPDSVVEAGFYGCHRLRTDERNPWTDPNYHQWLIKTIGTKLASASPDLDTQIAWRAFRSFFGEKGMSASHAFTIELAMNGLIMLPHDPFFPLFADDTYDRRVIPELVQNRNGGEDVVIRSILAYDNEATLEAKRKAGITIPENVVKTEAAKETIHEVWEERTRDYRKGRAVWENRYQ